MINIRVIERERKRDKERDRERGEERDKERDREKTAVAEGVCRVWVGLVLIGLGQVCG